MLSASFNQTPNQGLRFNLSDNPMNDFTSNVGYHDSYPKSDMCNQYYHQNHYLPALNPDSKMYSISEVDSLLHSNNNSISNDFSLSQIDHSSNKELDFNMLSSRLQAMGIKSNCNLSRSNSAHNSPFDNRITPRHFSQSTSNTPLPLTNRLGRDIDMMRGNAPIMQLFPNNSTVSNPSNQMNNSYNMNRQSPVELIEYQSMASKMGFLVGQDLDEVLNRSATMKNSNSSRISNFFKHKHGSSGSHLTQKQYLVLGVRVPSKEHVSEIVGKEGKKIKMIRQTTGALIATPNEKEDHVFLIEAVPETAIKVGQIIQQLADQITRNKLGNITGLMGERPRSPPMLGNRTPLATDTIGVPQRLVGKVIGTQGSIITTVQKETGTEIKSPPKDELRAPGDTADFEISVYENGTVNSAETAWLQIHRAKQLIAHLVMRVWDQQPRNSTPSSDEGNCCTPSTCTPEWIWPSVSRMDDGDAKEIIDRILRSSKAKITPSTSSTEGTNLDGLGMPVPPSTGMSPPFSMSLHDGSSNGGMKQSSSGGGFHSVHTTPYKLLPEDGWSRVMSDCYGSSADHQQQPRRINGYKDGSSSFYPPQYSSMQPSVSGGQSHHQQQQQYYQSSNDSAFYDSYYPPSVYSPPSNTNNGHLFMSSSSSDNYGSVLADRDLSCGDHDSPSPPLHPCLSSQPLMMMPAHHNGNGNVSGGPGDCGVSSSSSSSWARPMQQYNPHQAQQQQQNHGHHSSNNSNNYADDTRYGNVKYLWKNCGPVDSSVGLDPTMSSSSLSWMPNMSTDGDQLHHHQQHQQQQQQQQQQIHLRHNPNQRSVPAESMFGTIGDGRKRNSAASNSDDREDL